MGIFSRFSDIVNSNINAILDKAEDPDKIIRMVIQEMEDTLVEVRSSAAKVIADQKDAERRMTRLKKAESDWEAKAELAISKGRDDLARGALMEKNKVSEMVAHMTEELAQLADALGNHEADVQKLEAKLREARAKKATIDARHTTATAQVRVRKNLYDTRIQDAFERFEKVEQRIDRLEGEAEAYALGDGETLEAAFQSLERDDSIEAELSALKARVSQLDEEIDAEAPAHAAPAAKKPATKKAAK